MGNNFQDNVTYGDSTLGFSGDQIFIGGIAEAGAKSLVFNSSDSNGHLAWLPSGDFTVNLPNANGTLLVNSQAILSISAGTTKITSGQLVFSNSNGISFGANGQTITAIYTVPGGGSPNFSAGTTSSNLASVVFSNSNNISFGLNGATITASIPVQSNQTQNWYGVGNTTNSSSTNFDARTISVQGTGGISIGFSNGSMQLSAPVVSSLSATGNVSISTNGSTISIGANAPQIAAGTQTASTGGVVVFSNSNGISFGMSDSSIITASYGQVITDYEPDPLFVSNSTTFLPGIGSWYFEPLYLPGILTGGRLNKLISMAGTASILVGSSASFNSGSTGTRSNAYNFSHSAAIYSRDTGTNSTRLASVWSNTFTIGLAQSLSVSLNAGTALTVTNGATISYIASINSVGAYTTSTLAGSTSISTAATTMAASTVTVGISSILNMLSGQLVIPIGINTTLQAGNYWLAHAYSTASTTGGTSIAAASQLSLVNYVGLQAANNSAFRIWGQTLSTSGSQVFPGAGVFSATTASPPSTVAFNDIRNVAAVRQYFNFVNSTI